MTGSDQDSQLGPAPGALPPSESESLLRSLELPPSASRAIAGRHEPCKVVAREGPGSADRRREPGLARKRRAPACVTIPAPLSSPPHARSRDARVRTHSLHPSPTQRAVESCRCQSKTAPILSFTRCSSCGFPPTATSSRTLAKLNVFCCLIISPAQDICWHSRTYRVRSQLSRHCALHIGLQHCRMRVTRVLVSLDLPVPRQSLIDDTAPPLVLSWACGKWCRRVTASGFGEQSSQLC